MLDKTPRGGENRGKNNLVIFLPFSCREKDKKTGPDGLKPKKRLNFAVKTKLLQNESLF